MEVSSGRPLKWSWGVGWMGQDKVDGAGVTLLVMWADGVGCHRSQGLYKCKLQGVPIVAQWVENLTSIHEEMDLIPGLIQWVTDLAVV